MALIQPKLKDEDLLADIASVRGEADDLHLWWLGQSGFLVHWSGQYLLLDPYLSDSLTSKYAGTDKPHVRMTERCVDPARLNFINVTTSSHNHTDHLDAETLGPLLRVNPQMRLVVPEANRNFVMDRIGQDYLDAVVGMEAGGTAREGGFVFHGVPAAHNELETDDWGRHKFMGYVIEAGPWTVYHSGDTLRYEGMVERLRQWQIDVAILPINGNRPERRVAGNLDGAEAAQLAKHIEAKMVIPCHFEMFEFNTVTPEAFVETCRKLRQPYRLLRCGERWNGRELDETRQ